MFVFIGALAAYEYPSSGWQHFGKAYNYIDRCLPPNHLIEPCIPSLENWRRQRAFVINTYIGINHVIKLANSMELDFILHLREKSLDQYDTTTNFYLFYLEVSNADAFIIRICCPWIEQHIESID